MIFLVIGSGGREHAIVWKLLQSSRVTKVYAAPGNGGTDGMSLASGGAFCENVDLGGRDPSEPESQEFLTSFAREKGVDCVIIGPEAPLAAGIADRLREAGLSVVGPGVEAARLESSKAFAKAFMEEYGVRAAASRTFTNAEDALAAARDHFSGGKQIAAPPPLVIKADGLAAGKGVVLTSDPEEAEKTIRSFMEEGALSGAGKTVVIEEFLEGKEVSVLAAVSVRPESGGTILPFVSARDHKRRFDGDRGPNTGGMGAIAPVPDFDEAARADFTDAILTPTLRGMKARGFDYRGFIFFGLMVKDGKCRLLEYNVRLGDPETQAVLPLMESDFGELCAAAASDGLEKISLQWKRGAVCAPAAVADGYPGPYRKGDIISIDGAAFEQTGAVLFAAGALKDKAAAPHGDDCGRSKEESRDLRGLYTAGGRVLAVSAYGENGGEAREKAYRAMRAISFEGMDYRRDIGG